MTLMIVFLLLCGFALLLAGAEWLVRGAGSLAKMYHVPELVIGLTVVAFGTSTPELTVNLVSNLKGATDICFGNPIGSNTVNILLILGLTALICPLSVKRSTTWKEIPFILVSSCLVMLLANNIWLYHRERPGLNRMDGVLLLFVFALFLHYTWRLSQHGKIEVSDVKTYPLPVTLLAILGGLAGLIWGGKLAVVQAVRLAEHIGISQKFIGLTVVAFGTSLPELATTLTAALRKHHDIAVGNVVGSGIFNILFILGTTALVKPLPYPRAYNRDFGVMFASVAVLFIFMFIGTRHRLQRWQGGLMVLLYALYVFFQIA